MFLYRLCMHWVLCWGCSLHWEERISGAVCHLRKANGLQSGYSYDIGERRSVQDEENGPQYWALRHTVHELWWWRRRVIDWSGLISVWEVWVKPLECSRLNAKKPNSGGRGEFGGQQCQKDPTKEEQKCCHCPERKEYRLQYVTKRS